MTRPARIALPVFVASCLLIFLFFWLGSIFVSNPQTAEVTLRLPSWDEARWWLGRPDTAWYIDIAQYGYKAAPYSSVEQTNWAFFPAYPLLLRLVAHGQSPEFFLIAGFCFSLLFFGIGVSYFTRLLLEDYEQETVLRAVVLFCFYPFAYSLIVFGPDSLLLLAACASFYYARGNRRMTAGIFAAVACATRVQGVLVVPCLLFLYWKKKRTFDRAVAPLLLAPVTLLAFMWHLWRITGNPLAFVGIQRAWTNLPSYPFAFLIRWLRAPVLVGADGWDPELLSVVVTCAALALLIWIWRKRLMPGEYTLFFALQLLVLVSHTSTLGNLRYLTSCFPFALSLGILTKRPLSFALLLALFAGLLGLFAALFAAGEQHHPGYHFAAF